jgi:hypothetical protein
MQSFPKPSKLNGEQLLVELADAGIVVDKVMVIDENLYIDTDAKETKSIVAKHIGIDTDGSELLS